MECRNCYCSINHGQFGQFCSNACGNAWAIQDAQIVLTKNIKALLAEKEIYENQRVEMESIEKEVLKSKQGRKLFENDMKKQLKQSRLELKITKCAIIICLSIRDKKGTYPQLKTKFCELLDEFMETLETSGELCEVAEVMKQNYEWFETLYSVLK
jgi:hypothetical protein